MQQTGSLVKPSTQQSTQQKLSQQTQSQTQSPLAQMAQSTVQSQSQQMAQQQSTQSVLQSQVQQQSQSQQQQQQQSSLSSQTQIPPVTQQQQQSQQIPQSQPVHKIPTTSILSNLPSKQQNSVQSPILKASPASVESLISPPLTTIANGYSTAIPPISSAHTISSSRISTTSPSSLIGSSLHMAPNQISVSNTNGNANGLVPTPPSSLPVPVPQQPQVAAPTGPSAVTHTPHMDSLTVVSARTNSPAVATSATPTVVGPTLNGSLSAPIMSTNGAIPPYRSLYPSYPLYAPYSNLHHSPYLPPAVQSPAASPRTIESRTSRESPLVSSSKSVRPITPSSTNNTNSLNQTQPTQPGLSVVPQSSLREVQPPTTQSQQSLQQQNSQSSQQSLATHSLVAPSARPHSPRGHSPTRERDSYRFVFKKQSVFFLSY